MQANDEMLPHVLMGDVTRCAIMKSRKLADRFQLRKLLRFFEDGLGHGGENVRNLIDASFAENLHGEDQALATIKSLSGTLLM
jgi:hypothetical protein